MATRTAEPVTAEVRVKVRPWTTGVKILGFKSESRAETAGLERGDVIIQYGEETNLTSERLVAAAGAARPLGASVQVVFVRGDAEHSVSLPPGALDIMAMDVRSEGLFGSQANQVRIDKTILWIQRIYLLFAVVGILAMFGAMSLSESIGLLLPLLGIGPIVLLLLVIYRGLRIRIADTNTLVLIISAFQFLECLFLLLSPAQAPGDLFAKVLVFPFFLLFAYQIRFFSRTEVRALFKDKGTLVT